MTEHPADLSATDAALDIITSRNDDLLAGLTDDPLERELITWRAAVHADPIPELIDVPTARRIISRARLRHRLRMGALRWALYAWLFLITVLVLWWVVGCTPDTGAVPGFTPTPTSSVTPTPDLGPVPRTPPPCAGEKSRVCPESPTAGIERFAASIPAYHREAFMKDWARVHGNCDTREAVLERDAAEPPRDDDGDGCKDDAAIRDPYTGRLTAASQVDVDHVLSLGDAWFAGAYRWSPAQRVIFANDQSNLRAVGFSINRSKGDRGPDEWSPPTCEGRHVYAVIYRATARRWALEITPAKDAALIRDMAPC